MTHKLADTWKCRLMAPNGDHTFEGHMDLSRMSENGELEDGRFYVQGDGVRTLKGQASGGNPVYFLLLKEFDDRGVHRATYDGLLVHEDARGVRLVIVGKKHFQLVGASLDVEAADQNDPPWILTKP